MSNESEIDPYEAARRAARATGEHLDGTPVESDVTGDAIPLPKPSHLNEPTVSSAGAFSDPTMASSDLAGQAAESAPPIKSDPQMISSAETGSDFATAAAAALGAEPSEHSPRTPSIPKKSIRKPSATRDSQQLKAARDSVKARLAARQAAEKRVGVGGIVFGVLFLLAGGFILSQAVASNATWGDVQGLSRGGEKASHGGNALRRMQQVLLREEGELRLQEAALNRYIAKRLAADKAGLFAGFSEDVEVGIDLKPSVATVMVKELVLGRPVTYSVTISDTPSGKLPITVTGTKTGKLPLGSGLDAIQALSKALEEELIILKSVKDIRFEEGAVVMLGLRL